ncbi:MAG: tRNA (adenosine(37)-N6)-dimethylallyltransferase MiaA, partial [Bdellovibrionota bacterium]
MSSGVIVIAGATASGKSALALQLARALRAKGRECEILCADSVTVYRGFDIGAAKPLAAERAEFRHHLLDVADPREEFTAGDFVRLSIPAIAGIHARGATPLLVGGTGFYLRALLRGMASNEEEDTERARAIKAELEARARAEGFAALHAEVIRLDPGSAPTVHPNDHYRVIRALQAMRLYGKPWSELNKHARSTS